MKNLNTIVQVGFFTYDLAAINLFPQFNKNDLREKYVKLKCIKF